MARFQSTEVGEEQQSRFNQSSHCLSHEDLGRSSKSYRTFASFQGVDGEDLSNTRLPRWIVDGEDQKGVRVPPWMVITEENLVLHLGGIFKIQILWIDARRVMNGEMLG